MAKSFSLDGLVAAEGNSSTEAGPTDERKRRSKGLDAKGPTSKTKDAASSGPPKRLSLTLTSDTYRTLRLHAVETDQTHQTILEAATIAYLRKHAST